MNLRDLKYLVALADLRHFGKAADASHISQPTLSMQIKKLEDELGVQLIERAPRKVMLTPIGREIVARARRILRDADELRELARRSQDPESGTVRLGAFPTLAPYFLPHAVPTLLARFPQMQWLLVEEKSDVLLTQLRDGRIDAALLALPLHDDTLQAAPLFDEPFFLAVPATHTLATHATVTLSALDGQSVLLLEDGHCLRDQALDVCQLSGAQESSGFRATSLETLRQMVAAGNGITLLPALAVQATDSPSPRLQTVPFAAPAPHRRIALVWRNSSAMHAVLMEVAAQLRALAHALPHLTIAD